MKTSIYKYLFLISILSFSACKKDYLDVNTDPNNPADVTIELLLPPVLGYTAYNLGNPYQIVGGLWSQYWTQGPTASQYLSLDQYVITSSSFVRPWDDSYAGALSNCDEIIKKGLAIKADANLSADEQSRGSNYAAIAKIMQAFIFQTMSDLHGDIPFSEAIKGRDEDGAVLSPKFDDQTAVYDGLITLINDGITLVDVNGAHPAADDYFFAGDMELWTKFANTLKLKIYLRQVYVRESVARQGIQAMFTANAEFLGNGEDALVPFTDDQFNRNPLFTTITALSGDNLIASRTSIDYLTNTNDPRIDVFFAKAAAAPNTGNQVGIIQGNAINLPPNQNANSFSKPSPNVGGVVPANVTGGATAPVIIMSGAESLLLQAEAIARGYAVGDAASLYNEAIDASFEYWGLEDDAVAYKAQTSTLYPTAGTLQAKLKAIIVQKWVCMTGTQNIEAWTEWRRTGYPDFFTLSASNSSGGIFPVRLLYPNSEVNRNPNTPSQKRVTDKLWWDTNTTGQN